MTVSTSTSRIEYTGDAVTTVFSFPYYFLANGDLKVYLDGVLQTITTHYTVTGAGMGAGGTVTFVTAPPSADVVVIYREVAITQAVDYTPNDPFPANTHEQALDRLTMIAQQLNEETRRALALPATSTYSGLTVPDPEAGKYLMWKSDLSGLENVVAMSTTGVTVTPFAESYLDDTDAGATLETLGTAQHVNDMATLREIAPSSTRTIWMKYHTTAGDGGHGFFRAVTGATAGTYTHNNGTILVAATGDGSAAWLRVYSGAVNVRWFGAAGDGVTDYTAEIQAAITATSGAGTLVFPEGVFIISAELTITAPMTIRGAGNRATYIRLATATQNGFVINTTQAVHFEYLRIGVNVVKTAGAGVKITASSSNAGSTFLGCTINDQVVGLHFERSGGWVVSLCELVENSTGIFIQNLNDVDEGDSCIASCIFDTSKAGTTYGVRQESSGGLKITNTKILHHSFGYALELAEAAVTSILLISNCSIELQSTSGIRLTAAGSTGSFSQFNITGNQFSSQPVCLEILGGFAWLESGVICGNTFQLATAGTGVSASRGEHINISGNTINGVGGASVGITAGVNSDNIDIGLNTFNNVATKTSNTASINSTYTTQQTGTVSINATTAYGALYTESEAIVFPKPYLSAPALSVCPIGSGGGCGGGYDSVGTSGATLRAFGAISGIVDLQWVAEGILE